MKYILMLLALISTAAFAEDNLTLRPHMGIGSANSTPTTGSDSINHIGIRLLLNAGGSKKYGLELTQFESDSGHKFQSIGIVIEQKKWGWFNMSIGTVGYFDYTDNTNPVGLMTNLGWEPESKHSIKPFITYRGDLIFADQNQRIHSISSGLTFSF